MGSLTEVAPGTVGLVFAVQVVIVAVLLFVPTTAAAVPAAAVSGVTVVPYSFRLGFAFGDPVLSAASLRCCSTSLRCSSIRSSVSRRSARRCCSISLNICINIIVKSIMAMISCLSA